MDFMKKYFDKFLVILIIIFITVLIDKFIDYLLNNTMKRRKEKKVKTILVFLKKIKRVLLYGIAFLMCLMVFDQLSTLSVTLLSGLGIGSVVLGLAAQESLKNFFGSIAIVFGSPFEVGDFVECSGKGVSGTIEDITLRHTVIRTIHNRRVIVPNGEMNYFIIENFNYGESKSLKLVDFSVAYEADIDKAIYLIEEEMRKLYDPTINKHKDIEYPKVRVASLGDSGVTIRAWVWGVDLANLYENIYALNYMVKKSFQDKNVEIPYPRVQVIEDKYRRQNNILL